MQIKSLLGFATLLFHVGLWGQLETLKIDHFPYQSGAPQSYINTILQSNVGYMWFGTESGLAKFNGYTFTFYTHDPTNRNSLSSNKILSLCEDRTNGFLWIGLQNGALNQFDLKTGYILRFAIPQDETLITNAFDINSIKLKQDGNLWIGTGESGLYEFRIATKSFKSYPSGTTTASPVEVAGISSIILDPTTDILWISTFFGVYRFESSTGHYTQFLIDPDDPESARNYITSSSQDSTGALFLGTEIGELFRFDPKTEVFQRIFLPKQEFGPLDLDGINSLFIDRHNLLWIGTWDGLIRYNLKTHQFLRIDVNEFDPYSLTDGSITCIFEDKSGFYWFGTADGGLNTYSPRKSVFKHVYRNQSKSGTLSSNLVFSICAQCSGTLWIGTSNGLNRLNPDSDRFQTYFSDPEDPTTLSNSSISVLFEDSHDILWVGTEGDGLNRWDEKSLQFTRYLPNPGDVLAMNSGFVSALAEDHASNLWIGTQDYGLNQWLRAENRFERFVHDPSSEKSVSADQISSIYCDRSGAIWVGTRGAGLNKFDPTQKCFIRYNQQSETGSNTYGQVINSIFEDSRMQLWVGTNLGLNHFNRETGEFKLFSSKDGLSGEAVMAIKEDLEGNLWLATNRGLSRFNNTRDKLKNFSVSDGLQSDRFFPMAVDISNAGELFFGGTQGFNRFFPDRTSNNRYDPPVVFTNFKIFDTEVFNDQDMSQLTEIRLKHTETFFSFEFSAMDFNYPEHNMYAYKMDGFDENWVNSGIRHYASYTNLNPGKYTFSVKTTNSDGVWSQNVQQVGLIITPPFWNTWWFRLTAILIISSLLYGLFRYRVRLLTIQTHKLQEEVSLQTIDLRTMNQKLEQTNVLKELLLDVITHDLRNPIGVIDSMADYILTNNPEDEAISLIRSSSASVLRVMANATTLARVSMDENIEMESLNICSIIDNLIKEFKPILKAADLTVENALTEDCIITANPIIEEVFKNYISNAVKYASHGKRLIVEKIYDGHTLTISVKDFGTTIPEHEREAVFQRNVQLAKGEKRGRGLGLAIVQRIAHAHHAEVGVKANEPQGNIFYISIPV